MTARLPLRAVAVAAAVGLAALAGGCGEDGDSAGTASTTIPAGAAALLPPIDGSQPLPPDDVAALRRLYDPALATMGLRLTRAQLIDLSKGSYTPSPTGTHLAMYVEPVGEYTDEQYVQGFWDLAALITPDVFARWSELQSYDICQEPMPSVNDDPEPFPITQVNITREAAAAIDWQHGSLTDLVRAARTDSDVKLVVSRAIRQSPAYKAAIEATEPATATTSTVTTP
ncbi:hypothetical protein [Rhabdothermincola sp.]|uniref:hypothetical protein n=1 Tax=Rhabdothermincola sp. TaxID=2820405 RepID=UPI002FE008E9